MSCPSNDSNYHMINGKCYYIQKVGLAWEKAKEGCRDKFVLGGKLFEPSTWEESKAVYEFAKTYLRGQNTAFWIGVDDFGQDGSFKHSYTGQPISFNIKWNSHYGSQGGVGNGNTCILVHQETGSTNGDGEWIDYGCHKTYYSICESIL